MDGSQTGSDELDGDVLGLGVVHRADEASGLVDGFELCRKKRGKGRDSIQQSRRKRRKGREGLTDFDISLQELGSEPMSFVPKRLRLFSWVSGRPGGSCSPHKGKVSAKESATPSHGHLELEMSA
jgi:hypothetical protein